MLHGDGLSIEILQITLISKSWNLASWVEYYGCNIFR